MSLKAWLKKFYPVPAHECLEHDAIDHSLLKWKGLTKANLKLHRLWHSDDYIEDGHGKSFNLSQRNCALCHQYYDSPNRPVGQPPCAMCPLAAAAKIVRPSTSMASLGDVNCGPEWREFLSTGNTVPMLHLLITAKKIVTPVAAPARPHKRKVAR